MLKEIRPAFVMTVLLTLFTGIIYPVAVTGIARVAFPWQTNGSLIERDGSVIGSGLIGQNFSSAQYFHGRPSAAGKDGYDAAASGGSNLGPTSRALIDRTGKAVAALQAEGASAPIPADLVTTSGSGLDPHISPAAAFLQIPRLAKARHLPEDRLQALVTEMIEPRTLGLLGEPRINVLRLNLALDQVK